MQTNRSNAGALVGGAIMIAFGLLALAGQVFRSVDWGFLWPFTVIGIGALFFVAMFAGGKQTAGFAIPGSIVGGIGLVLLFQYHRSLGIHVLLLDAHHHFRRRRHLHHGLVRR
jgi:hypothetical protein